jgi:hypothetical protein
LLRTRLAAIAEIHAQAPLNLETLVRRFEDEMTPIGQPSEIRGKFLVMIEKLFPDSVEAVEERLRKRRG